MGLGLGVRVRVRVAVRGRGTGSCCRPSCGVLVQVHTPLLVQLVARLGRGEACAGAEECLRAARELRWPEAS